MLNSKNSEKKWAYFHIYVKCVSKRTVQFDYWGTFEMAAQHGT